jgi:hypothetical protein
MNIYVICAVRNASQFRVNMIREHVERLRAEGHDVHFPPDDVNQDDPTGEEICNVHLAAMIEADEVHTFWDVESKGSHFDLGMAYALGKKIVPSYIEQPDTPGKSYWKAVIAKRPSGVS